MEKGKKIEVKSYRKVVIWDTGAAPHLYSVLRLYGMTKCVARSAFTLIELLVVVFIIGVLAAIALPQYQKAVWRSRASEVKVFAKNLADAQGIYRLHNGTYAQDFSQMDIKL